MHRIHKTSRPVAAALLLSLAILVLAACGGSSSGSTSPSSSTGSTSSAPTGAAGGRFAAVRECLQKNGITLPRRTPGQGRPQGGGLLGAGGTRPLPSGVTRAQYEAALQKCGAGSFGGGGARFSGTAFKQALPKFAACMRENGINLPAPNTSGNGPVFNTKGLNTSSAQFRGAQAKCQPILVAARGPAGGAAGGGPGGGGASGAG
ncbi:MAG TPA: hypothetical protein VNZ01_03730 [Solirubrobacteraceae bacterium]|jgi:hypothetical protein|nr:hypothetical protein [Solirubrobacteraceae bacterium]